MNDNNGSQPAGPPPAPKSQEGRQQAPKSQEAGPQVPKGQEALRAPAPPAPSGGPDPGGEAARIAAVAPFRSPEEESGEQTAWSLKAWRAAAPVLEKILEHPFINGLLDGTLPRERFLFYIGQDALYLADYGRLLAAASLKAENDKDAAFLCESALAAVQVEGALHESYLKGEKRAATPTPANLLYTSYLYRHLSRSPFSTIMASLLPCFWIYQSVGRHMLALAGNASHNPYRDWISTYGGEEFGRSVEKAVRICDRLAAGETPKGREGMLDAFMTASRMEWMFWDSAWKMEPWPV
ncbi:MAG: thiaminase II [Deltaproteobacteria bacterium]|jgi:thiaminase/transcriptional activator TenA|nr:thiaminase II [Deltaproteobacteria bacterium]